MDTGRYADDLRHQDLRLDPLNTLLTTPHRQPDALQPLHAEMVRKDPRFYVRLAAWYNDHGDVRDHKEMFIITLVLSDFEGYRDAGLAMLRALPPYQVVRQWASRDALLDGLYT